jgi:hypothetical protein
MIEERRLMEIKSADGRQEDVAELRALQTRYEIDASTRRAVEQEIKKILAGAKGEKEAAYEIEFQFKDSPNWMTIHDLRIDFNGRVAQIDHLLINRLMQIWVCESKHFTEGVGVDDRGEWVRFFAGRPSGMASPVEQNKRHITVLEDLFRQGKVASPRRLGMAIKPEFKSVVLISNDARISRPRNRLRADELTANVMKCEQLDAMLTQRFDRDATVGRMMTRLVASDTIQRLAIDLVSLHKPITFDWAAKFGLSPAPPTASSNRLAARSNRLISDPGIPFDAALLEDFTLVAPVSATSVPNETRPVDSSVARTTPANAPNTNGATLDVCADCGHSVTKNVIAYCQTNVAIFGGATYCFACQKKHRKG